MKVWLTLMMIICLGLSGSSQNVMKVISYNIRYNNINDGEDQWNNRKEGLASFIAEEEADFIGMQEVLHHQLIYLKTILQDYDHIGVGRDDADTLGEYSPILYNATKWQLVKNKNKWLSQTPDEVSKGWDSNFNRILNFGLFRNILTGDTVAIFNTHFDHVAKEARRNSSHLVTKWVDDFANVDSKVVTGDFNLEPSDPNYSILTERLVDSRSIATERYEDHVGTFNGFKLDGKFDRRIDYIFVEKDMKVKSYNALEIRINGRQISDHFPVIAEIIF